MAVPVDFKCNVFKFVDTYFEVMFSHNGIRSTEAICFWTCDTLIRTQIFQPDSVQIWQTFSVISSRNLSTWVRLYLVIAGTYRNLHYLPTYYLHYRHSKLMCLPFHTNSFYLKNEYDNTFDLPDTGRFSIYKIDYAFF